MVLNEHTSPQEVHINMSDDHNDDDSEPLTPTNPSTSQNDENVVTERKIASSSPENIAAESSNSNEIIIKLPSEQINNQKPLQSKQTNTKNNKTVTKFTQWLKNRKNRQLKCSKKQYTLMTPEEKSDVKMLLIDLGYAMGTYGVPVHHIEHNLSTISNYYGITASFIAYPNVIWFSFGVVPNTNDHSCISSDHSTTHFFHITNSAINLDKLDRVDQLCRNLVSKDDSSASEANEKVISIVKQKSLFPNSLLSVMIPVIFGFSFSILLNCTWPEIIFVPPTALVVSLINFLRQKSPLLNYVGFPLGSFCAMLMGVCARCIFYGAKRSELVDPTMILLPSVILLIPGLPLTIAAGELNAGRLQAGVTRLAGSFVIIVKLCFGAFVAYAVHSVLMQYVDWYAVDNSANDITYPFWIRLICVPLVFGPLSIQFKLPLYFVAYGLVCINAYIAYAGANYLRVYMGLAAGNLISAFILGLVSNIYGYLTKRPSLMITVCSWYLILPSALTGLGIRDVLTGGFDQTGSYLVQLVTIPVSVVIGLIIAEYCVPRREFSYST
ncbi:hypothetical protein AKO1_007030 [Acrasis kona]|uniref:Threonine/serine exporter-like N-terminal domain-containing protein n=1 Tax=Acrasis kona TaxID=1008807 RepID=A0AAW2YUB5_9EUKA